MFKVAHAGYKLPAGFFCSQPCITGFAIKQGQKRYKKAQREQSKRERKERQERKEKLKDRRWYERKAQQLFNKRIRKRDKGKPCVSCGVIMFKKVNAGHYRSTASAPQLRFNEDNCHAQCEKCNSYLSGNIREYRIGLLKRIGEQRLYALENNNELKKWTIDELKLIIDKYKC